MQQDWQGWQGRCGGRALQEAVRAGSMAWKDDAAGSHKRGWSGTMRKARGQMQVRGRGAVGVGGRGVVVVEGGGGGVRTSPRPLLTSPHGRAPRWAAGLPGCWLAGLSAAVLSVIFAAWLQRHRPRARPPSPQSSAARSTCSSNNSLLWRTGVVSAVSLFRH